MADYIQLMTSRAQSKVDDFAQPNLKNATLEFKPDKYSSKGVGAARIAPSNQPGYAGHRPGCMDYNLGMSYGAFSRHSRNVSSAKGAKSFSGTMTKLLPEGTSSGRSVNQWESMQKTVMKQTTRTKEDARSLTTDHVIVNHDNHWFGSRDGFARKENGGLWRSTQRNPLEWEPTQAQVEEDIMAGPVDGKIQRCTPAGQLSSY